MKRLVIKIDEYQKDGQTKGKYVELGVIMSGENGEYALINPNVNLAGCLIQQRVMNQGKQNKGKGDMVMCSIFERDSGQQSQQPERQAQHPADDVLPMDDSIPF